MLDRGIENHTYYYCLRFSSFNTPDSGRIFVYIGEKVSERNYPLNVRKKNRK